MHQRDTHTSSTGHELSNSQWLDVHFEANRPEYEAQLRAVGIQPRWHVLDAACGSGSFLPLLADLVGSEGQLTALDLAPENVSVVEQRAGDWQLICPFDIQVGNVLALPYPDNAFDAVWFANTTAYLTDEELRIAVAELRRVVRPGGLVGVKEVDCTMYRIVPAPHGLILRRMQAAADIGNVPAAGWLRAPALPRWLRRAGLVDVWRRTTLMERSAPLDPIQRSHRHSSLRFHAGPTADLDLPTEDQDFWSQLREPAGLEHFLDNPDFSFVEANMLTVGTVPIL